MSDAFVWFHNNGDKPDASIAFYEELLGWKASEGPGGMKMLGGEKGPFAALGVRYGDSAGWIPFAVVESVDAATAAAVKLGGTLILEKTRGPAGEFSVVRDPGGSTIALWQKA